MSKMKMYSVFGKSVIFGRTDVQSVTGLKSTRASELLKALLEAKVIESVSGYGKGKYRFCEKGKNYEHKTGYNK